jgi:biopolymer transport protein ExbB/TolQ
MNLSIDLLNFLSSGLLIPCIALLLILFVQSLHRASELFIRYRGDSRKLDAIGQWLHDTSSESTPPLPADDNSFSRCLSQLHKAHCSARATHLIAEYESQCERRLGSLNRLAKLGPILGLLGTLIPMGPALEGLARGDVQQLASQMQVAFTTTVVGLVIGAIGFVLFQLQRQIISRELAILDCVLGTRFGAASS